MLSVFNPENTISYLQQYLTNNKALGLTAELSFENEISQNELLIAGGWLLSPSNNPQGRHFVYILPKLYETMDNLEKSIEDLRNSLYWNRLVAFFAEAGIRIILSGAYNPQLDFLPNRWTWLSYVLHDQVLEKQSNNEPYGKWGGGRGRPSKGGPWTEVTLRRFGGFSPIKLEELILRQAFYYSYLKTYLKKSIGDPYDVDGFMIGNTTLMPVEVKEKSRTPKGEFGIDAGRILMLLRLCLPTNTNALYLIREIDTTEGRNLIGWKYVSLADIVLNAKWNLQGGGKGMTGGNTQTVMLPYSIFKDFSPTDFTNDAFLADIERLGHTIKSHMMFKTSEN